MNITVTPMSAVEHAYMQREAERRKNDPPDEMTTCIHCGNVIDLEDEGDEAIWQANASMNALQASMPTQQTAGGMSDGRISGIRRMTVTSTTLELHSGRTAWKRI